MLIIARTFEFVSMAVTAIIIVIIALMILRLIANASNLNPFAWASRTIHRLTDVFVLPMRRGLMSLGFDPKYAPLVVILVTIVLGLFVNQLAGKLGSTALGVLDGIQDGRPVLVVGHILNGAISVYILFITMWIIFSWVRVSYSNRIMRFLVTVTEPLLGPLRRLIPPLGMFDISPLVALLALWLIQGAIWGTLLSDGRLR